MSESYGNETVKDEFILLMERWTFPRLAGSPGSYKIVDLLKEDFKNFDFQFIFCL